MRRNYTLRIPLLLFCAVATIACGTQSYRADEGSLARRVQARQQGGRLSSYLSAVSEETGVRHRATSPYADYPIEACNIDFSLLRFQRALAQTYHLSWKLVGGQETTYTLYEHTRDKQRRADALAAAQRIGRERLFARWQTVRQMAFQPSRKGVAASSNNSMASVLKNPRAGAMARLVFQLPDSLMQRVWGGEAVRLPVRSLSPDLRRLAVEAMGNITSRALGQDGQIFEVRPEMIQDGSLLLSLGGTPDRPTVWAGLRHERAMGVQPSFNLLDVVAFQKQPPSDRRRELRQRPSKRSTVEELQRRVSLRDPAVAKPHEAAERPAGAKPLAILLEDLSNQTGIPVVAECEYRAKDTRWLQSQWWLASEIVSRPLDEALNLLCADFEYEWEFRDGILLLRPLLWYLKSGDREYRYPPDLRHPPR